MKVMQDKAVYLLYAETQLHAGSGPEIGSIDLPIQRERKTRFPVIQGIKGALRSYCRISHSDLVEEIFGSEIEGSAGSKPGNVAFSEAKILLFPVRNPDKLFVWVTCPLVMSRFLDALDSKNTSSNNTHDSGSCYYKEKLNWLNKLLPQLSDEKAFCLGNVSRNEKVWLEEIALDSLKNQNEKEIMADIFTSISKCAPVEYLKNKLTEDVVIVSDNLFSQIVATMTEVVPRIRLSESGTTEEGALWYEEYLPQDTAMYFVARPTVYANEGILDKLNDAIDGQLINIGGKETVGKGMVWVTLFGREGDKQ